MEILRSYIRQCLTEVDINHSGAGIIVVKEDDDDWIVLALIPNDRMGLDIPKGRLEKGEEPMETALRETEEESSLTASDLDFKWGLEPLIIDSRLFLYVAATTGTPKIRKNPDTGKKEHKGVKWLTFKQMESKVLNFLKPGIVWAQNKVQS